MSDGLTQCKSCPWRKGVKPERDIPNGYDVEKHERLRNTIAKSSDHGFSGSLRMMACHQSNVGEESPCVGWLSNQLGPGNNIALRLHVLQTKSLKNLTLLGPQHDTFEQTLPKSKRRRR